MVSDRTRYERQNEASPPFRFSIGAIAAGAFTVVSFETSDRTTQKYLPFNFVIITNNSSADLVVYPNQNTATGGIDVPAGTVYISAPEEIPAISSVRIDNIEASTAVVSGEVRVTAQRKAVDTQRMVASIHRKIFKMAG